MGYLGIHPHLQAWLVTILVSVEPVALLCELWTVSIAQQISS